MQEQEGSWTTSPIVCQKLQGINKRFLESRESTCTFPTMKTKGPAKGQNLGLVAHTQGQGLTTEAQETWLRQSERTVPSFPGMATDCCRDTLEEH